MSLYEAIFFSLRDDIEAGVFPPGSRLPSIRETAERFNCNKITVKKAFDRLKAEGLIENQVGRGSFVSYPRYSASQQYSVYPFHSARINGDFFPVAEAGELFTEMFRGEENVFAAGPMGGDPTLIQLLANRYKIDPEATVIISGAQQGLNLCSTLYDLDISRHIVFEDPTYSGAISVFRPKHFVPLLEDGPDLHILKQLVHEKVRFFYAIPQVHNPTGLSYSEEKMQAVAEYAEEHNFFIIEDDYLSEFTDQRIPRFVDRIPHKTIYIKSLSKLTAPGIRLGFMTVPPRFYRDFIYGKYTADIGTPLLMQRFITRFISSGMMDSHLEKCRRKLAERRTLVEEVLGRYAFLRFDPRQAGYNLWVQSEIPLAVPNPPWAKGENFSFSSQWKNSFRLSLLSLNDSDFRNGVKYLDSLFQGIEQSLSGPVL